MRTRCWLLLTLGFGVYVAKFGNYNATYGSLGTVVVMLTWLSLSSYVLLFEAELNSALEHKTAADMTDAAAQPLEAAAPRQPTTLPTSALTTSTPTTIPPASRGGSPDRARGLAHAER